MRVWRYDICQLEYPCYEHSALIEASLWDLCMYMYKYKYSQDLGVEAVGVS